MNEVIVGVKKVSHAAPALADEDDDWDDDEESDGVYGHRWDEPIRLVWVGRLGGR